MAWLVERDEGFGPGRAAAFEAWRHRHARHAMVVAELEEMLAELDGLAARRAEVNERFGRISPRLPEASRAPTTPVRWWRPVAWGGVAAALIVSAFLGLHTIRSTTAPERLYATTIASYERARLEDGSTLELNTASVARVRFTPAERRVELEAGEAHFEVAHDSARPFVVHASGVEVRAVGTAFNVRYGPGAVEITVTEGKVIVGAETSARGSVVPSGASGGSREGQGGRGAARALPGRTLLNARERLAVPLAAATGDVAVRAPAVERLAATDVRATLAWQRRVTDFSDTPLADVAARFNRHHALQLVITDPVLGARRIGGMFALDDVEAFVRLLERDGIVRAEREGETVLLRAP